MWQNWQTTRDANMLDILPAYYPNSSNHENESIDVAKKGCFRNFNTIACARNGVMAFFAIITGLLCFVKIIKLHLNRHPTLHQYIIFYTAVIECVICSVHWLIGGYSEFDFITQYLKLIQFLVVCHFYWNLATRVLRKEMLSRWVLLPLLVVSTLYFTIVTVMGVMSIQSSWVECLQPQWLELSTAEFILVQLFMVAGFYISRRLNEISTLESVRRAQKRDLWGVIMVFELSAFAGLVYDITMKALGDEERGCSAIFLHMQEIYTPVFGIFMVIKFLLPIWAMLCVFQPIENNSDQDDLLPAFSEEGTYTSVFSPAYQSYQQTYKPLYYPGSESHLLDNDLSPSPTSSWQNSPRRRPSAQLEPIREEITPTTSSASNENSINSSIEQQTITAVHKSLRGAVNV
ncbi:uncharacterized protein LOC141904595 [Tubulanus polymorphus]|uniref:uncharacterized protein LOC141904595 n=1 Tax=Tubulanus polymorphus TaxID=672921 RepID=UPI003DA2ECF1